MALLTRLLVHQALILFVACILSQPEKDSLLALHAATGGPSWFTVWNTSTDPCAASWIGVVCDFSGSSVMALDLTQNNLVGTLPDLQLPTLESL